MAVPVKGRNVVRLITRLNVGGPARHALLLTRRLADDFPTVLGAGTPSASEGELSDPDVPVIRLPLVRPIQPGIDLTAVRAVRTLIARHRGALVHTHMAKAGAVGRTAVRSMVNRPRTIHTFHGHVLDGYFRPGAQRAFVNLERWLARTTDVLVAVSPEIRDSLLELRIGTPAQFRVIPLGLDLEPFLRVEGGATGTLRSEIGLDADVPLVGVVGRLVPIKDHATLLSAMTRLEGVHLAIIGDGERRPALEAQARQAGLAERVHFTGWRFDLAATLTDLDVVALTSRNEGTPVALIEALAAGRSVVSTDVGGVRSVVEHGTTGLLVPAGDAEGVASALARLLGSAELRQRLGQAGREHVRTRFGQQRLVDDVRALYGDLLGR